MMCVFLTSATGFLGGYLADYFLKEGVDLTVLARTKNGIDFKKRTLKSLNFINLKSKYSVNDLKIFNGDITLTNLGLSEIEVADIWSKGIQELWHSAGSVDFSKRKRNSQKTFEINLGGMKNILDFVLRTKIPEIHYISTAYSNGNSDVVPYDMAFENLPMFNNPYEKSKYLSEKLLLEWSFEHPEVKVFIYQPSIVVGDVKTGKVFNFFGYYRYMQVFYNFRKAVDAGRNFLKAYYFKPGEEIRLPIVVPGHAQAEINLVTIDYVIDVLMKLRKKGIVGVYPIVNKNPPLYGDLLKNSLKVFNISGVSTFDIKSSKKITKDLMRIESMINRGIDNYLPYISRTYNWDSTITIDQLGADYIEHPSFDFHLIERLMSFAIENDFDIRI